MIRPTGALGLAALWGLGCAPEETPLRKVSPAPAERDARVDLAPGIWPNRAASELVVGVRAGEGLDELLGEPDRAWVVVQGERWELSPAGTADLDGRPPADWLGQVRLPALAPGEVLRVEVAVEAGSYRWTGADLLAEASAELVVLPPPLGPYPVATQVRLEVDEARPDTLDPLQRARRLPLRLWYPLERPGQGTPSFLEPTAGGLAAEVLGFDPRWVDRLLAQASLPDPIRHRPVSDASPVVVLLPDRTPAALLARLGEGLASYGLVVVALEPPYSGIPVLLPEGPATTPATPPASDLLAEVWAADLSFLLDRITVWADDDSLLREEIDPQRAAVVGIGQGGAVATLALGRDPRWFGAVHLGGAVLPGSLVTPPLGRWLWAAPVDGPDEVGRQVLDLADQPLLAASPAGVDAWTDLPLVLPSDAVDAGAVAPEDLPEQGVVVLADLLLAWLDGGEGDRWADGSSWLPISTWIEREER